MTIVFTHSVSSVPAATVDVRKIAWVVHSPTPYKTPFFKMLVARPELDVTFLFLYWDDPQRTWNQEPLSGVKYKVLPGISLRKRLRESELVHFGPVVIRELRKGHFDLAVICGYGHPTLLLALLYCLVSGTPFVLQGESRIVRKRHPLKKALKRWFLFPLLRPAVMPRNIIQLTPMADSWLKSPETPELTEKLYESITD